MNGYHPSTNFIGALGEYPIYDYITTTSNNLATNITTTSNVISNRISKNINYTTNSLDTLNNLIGEVFEHNLLPAYDTKNTYIYNSNALGEIRFFCKSTADFPVNIPIGIPDYRVKINVDGKLNVYYTYDAGIHLTWGNGWIDVGNLVIGTIASTTNLGIAIGGVESQVVLAKVDYDRKFAIVYQVLSLAVAGDIETESINLIDLADNILQNNTASGVTDNLTNAYGMIENSIRNRNISYMGNVGTAINNAIYRNPIASSFLGAGGVCFALAYGIAQNMGFNDYLKSIIKTKISSNIHLTDTEKTTIKDFNENTLMASNTIKICEGYYNLGLNQGFINCNILHPQSIPSIVTNEILLNSVNTNNIYLNSNALPYIMNYNNLTNRPWSNVTNGINTSVNVGIGITNPTNKLEVNGTIKSSYNLIESTGVAVLKLKSTSSSASSTNCEIILERTNYYRGAGIRIITTDNTDNQWWAGIRYAGYDYQIGYHLTSPENVANGLLIINKQGNTTINATSGLTALNVNQFGSGNLLNINKNSVSQFIINGNGNVGIGTTTPTEKLDILGNIKITGNASISGILNVDMNLQEGGLNLSSKYLSLGGGQIYGKLAVSTGNEAIPSRGSFGGLGDRLVLDNGTNTTYPYALGIDTNNLWYSVPSGSSHYFYIGGSNVANMSSTGPNNSILTILGETNTSNSKIVIGSGFMGNINTLSSFVDETTCQIITKTNNLYIDAASGKTININSESLDSTVNSSGVWTHTNTLNAVELKENNVSLTNKYARIHHISIPYTSFNYDTVNEIWIYDLDVSQYVPSVSVYGGALNPIYFLTRMFRITTLMSIDFVNLDNLNEVQNGVCYSEPLTFYMSNMKNTNGIFTASANYCNGTIFGKLYPNKNVGYWNIIPRNYNYIRLMSSIGFETFVTIEVLNI